MAATCRARRRSARWSADSEARAGFDAPAPFLDRFRSRPIATDRRIADDERLMPHLHLSLQAGDDMILKRMKRRHWRADAIRSARRCGGCGRTSSLAPISSPAFRPRPTRCSRTRWTLVDECGLTFLHVFPFSPRPGTPAARMPQVDGRRIKARAAFAREGRGGAAGASRVGVGETRQVLIESATHGRTEHFMPVVDWGAARRDIA